MTMPAHNELEGKTWNTLTEELRSQILAEFGLSATQLEPVAFISDETREWFRFAALDVTAQKDALLALSEQCQADGGFGVLVRPTVDNCWVTSCYPLTDPLRYLWYYSILHNAPFKKVDPATDYADVV